MVSGRDLEKMEPELARFPIHGPNVFTLEYDTKSPAYALIKKTAQEVMWQAETKTTQDIIERYENARRARRSPS